MNDGCRGSLTAQLGRQPGPSCSYQPPCPGCTRFGEPGIAPRARAELAELASAHDCPVDFVETSGLGYRHRVRLSVRGKPGSAGLGIFEAGSHRLVSIPHCPVHHPSIEQLGSQLLEVINRSGVSIYDEARHAGLLRAVQMVVQRATSQVQVVLVVCAKPSRASSLQRELVEVLDWLSQHSLLHSLHLNFQPEATNTLLGPEFSHLQGPQAVSDACGGARVFFPPGAFGQANPVLHDQAVARIHADLAAGQSVVEYYAGVGTIGLGLLAQGHPTKFNELGESSLRGLRMGLRELTPESSVADVASEVLVGTAGSQAAAYHAGDVVIVDPPRKGLDRRLLERMRDEPPARLLYLSCGLQSLLADTRALSLGALKLERLTGYGYFPFTGHVETLACFARS